MFSNILFSLFYLGRNRNSNKYDTINVITLFFFFRSVMQITLINNNVNARTHTHTHCLYTHTHFGDDQWAVLVAATCYADPPAYIVTATIYRDSK